MGLILAASLKMRGWGTRWMEVPDEVCALTWRRPENDHMGGLAVKEVRGKK